MALSLDGTTGISATGNIISSAGIISATGNIYGGNIIGTIAPAAITVSGNATVGNLLTAGFVSATAVRRIAVVAPIALLCSSPIAPYASRPTRISFELSDNANPFVNKPLYRTEF